MALWQEFRFSQKRGMLNIDADCHGLSCRDVQLQTFVFLAMNVVSLLLAALLLCSFPLFSRF